MVSVHASRAIGELPVEGLPQVTQSMESIAFCEQLLCNNLQGARVLAPQVTSFPE